MPFPADALLSDHYRKYLKHPRDWSGMSHMFTEEPDSIKDFFPILLSPRPEDLEDPSYWWALSRAAMYLSDPSPIVSIYLNHIPSRHEFLPPYFSTLGMFFPCLHWKDVLRFYERLREYPEFWRFFSDYLARRADRRAYELILQNIDNPSFLPYLWRTVSGYLKRNGYRSPELLIALSRYADDVHYWRVLKRYLRRHPDLAPYVLSKIPSDSQYFLLVALSLAKSFPRHLYPVILQILHSGERSRVFLDALAALRRRYPHIFGDLHV